jgi:hypothetical protein
VRKRFYVDAEFGLGYALGIAGTSMMLLLLLYSLRKRALALRSWGPIRVWFNIHMALGVLGPVAILFHANFQLGSLNSTVALACVLLVASSGVVGRLIYPRIHHGLSSQRATLQELQRSAESGRTTLGAVVSISPGLAHELKEFEASSRATGESLLATAWSVTTVGLRSRAVYRRALRTIDRDDWRSNTRETRQELRAHLDAVRRVAEFRACERLFSLWHAFHLPFCVMLFTAAAIHVLAVHMY